MKKKRKLGARNENWLTRSGRRGRRERDRAVGAVFGRRVGGGDRRQSSRPCASDPLAAGRQTTARYVCACDGRPAG